MLKTAFNTFSNKRDYDKEPIVIKDYSYFFGVSLEYFSVIIGTTIMFYLYIIINITMNLTKEKIEIWLLIGPAIVPIIFVFYDYYAHVIRDNYRLYFTNNSINYMLNGKLKRKIDINEIPNYLLKPFWKNRFDTEVAIFILVIVVFIVSLWLIYATKPFPKEIYYFIVLWFASKLFANIVFKASLYLWLNKTLSGFRIFPILIVAEPIIDPKLGTGIWLSKQKYYFIYFYNEQIYDEIREYFLQNFDIDKTRKLITF
ncbi:hypothetical protein [Campylobacter ureolyticus]|uniref:hypothetical protein n=1 Tax=Campylobacter ureolyticus TaxID=827 RepID=UPI00290A9446|nr:hypothetical protein [Campylobacter ureolyticus]MDU5326661.1 hypothetical protein [Campylobacter ureolyticus]